MNIAAERCCRDSRLSVPQCLSTAFRNIADARAYEAERKRALALAEMDRAKTTFFSNVSHESLRH
jgi:hypothetical protein